MILETVNSNKKSLLKNTFGGFIKRGGIYIFLSTVLIKIIGTALSIIIVRLLTQEDFGNISFALSIIAIITVFAGLGSNWSLLRFGPTLSSFSEKFQLFKYSLKRGSLYTFFLIAIIIAISFFLPKNLIQSKTYLIILSFSLLTQFLFESFNSYLRIIRKNRAYSYSNIIGSISIFLIGIFLSYFFAGIGYTFALVFAPLLAFLFFYKRIFITGKIQINLSKKEFWIYGVYTGIGSIANQMIISLGPIISGYLNASAQEIALLKVATIIPFNLLILPSIIMTTDFVHLSKNYQNAVLLRNYYYSYLKTIVLLSFIPFILLFIYNEQIILLIFGRDYEGSVLMSLILNIGIFFAFLFRVPLGNILAAVGKANWNVAHTFFWLIIFVPVCFFVYPVWGMIGIAYSISFIFIFSGFISLGMFAYYLKIIKLYSKI